MPRLAMKNFLPSRERRKKLQRLVRTCFHVGKPEEAIKGIACGLKEWSGWELQLCNLVTWIGALAVTAIVLRSLYLMYLKPEGTWLYHIKKSMHMKSRARNPLDTYINSQICHVVAWTGVLFFVLLFLRSMYLKYNYPSELENY